LSRDRLAGALRCARAQSGKVEVTITHGDFSIESGIGAAEHLLDGRAPPTAIFCFNDEMAMGVLHVSRRRGLRVPEALSVMGFDDIRFAQYTDPPLTTIRQPMRELGEATVRLLLDIIDGHMRQPVSVTLPHALIVRTSTGPAPVRVRAPARRPVRSGRRGTTSAR
jgi:LacI family repressor for deo operon, udp, cdd, tsx, nupC, and nupG